MLEFCVENQVVTRCDNFRVVADSKNYLKAHFDLSDEWSDDTAVLFGYGDECFCALTDEDGCCNVPCEVIKPPFFTVSLFCGADVFVTSNVVCVDVEKSGLKESKAPEVPSPDIWQQYLDKMHRVIENGIPFVGENLNWFLYNPETELHEDSGVSAVGNAPVRGVDYWTDNDKAEIITEVLASFPDADKMGFPLDNSVSEVSEE